MSIRNFKIEIILITLEKNTFRINLLIKKLIISQEWEINLLKRIQPQKE
jgi:hypothetical protein